MLSKIKYTLIVSMLIALFLASIEVEQVSALAYAPSRAVFRERVFAPVVVVVQARVEVRAPVDLSSLTGVMVDSYRSTPAEDFNTISWVDPFKNKERQTVRWKYIIDRVLEENDYPIDAMLIMGMILQETGGYQDAVCNDFDTRRDTCAVGLMALTPGHCGLTESQLKKPALNIECGANIISQVYEQALEHGFRLGRDATRAALAAYNCSWPSLLADRCYSFGGWAYADKIGQYWIPLLEDYLD